MKLILNCGLTLALLMIGQAPVVAESDDPGKNGDDQRRTLLEQISSQDLTVRQKALQQILDDPDPLLLPGLSEILNQQDPSLRRQVTLIVLRSYPEQSFQFFLDASRTDGVHRREAAAHALGLIHDLRVIPLLKSMVNDSDDRIKNAALRSLQSLVRADLPQIFKKVSGYESEDPTTPGELCDAARDTLNQLGRSRPTQSNLQVARLRCLNSVLAEQNRNNWLNHQGIDPAHLKDLRQIFSSQRCWLGRSKPNDTLKYHFSMLNAVSGSSKEIDINASPHDIDRIRALDYDLDRVIHLRFVSDLFFNIPSALSPQIEFSGDHVDVVFNLERFPLPQAGVGLLNISYWETRILKGVTGHLRFDRHNSRLIEETLRDSSGKVLWKVTVPEWFDEHPSYPRKILVDVPGGVVGSKQLHLKLDLGFQFPEKDWLLSEARTVEITEDGEDLRAYCEVSWVSSASDSPGDEDPEGGSGSATESDSGQGSRARSPRE